MFEYIYLSIYPKLLISLSLSLSLSLPSLSQSIYLSISVFSKLYIIWNEIY